MKKGKNKNLRPSQAKYNNNRIDTMKQRNEKNRMCDEMKKTKMLKAKPQNEYRTSVSDSRTQKRSEKHTAPQLS